MVRLPSLYCSAKVYTIFSNPYASLYLGDTLLTLRAKAIGPMQKGDLHMKRLRKQLKLGVRWLDCGWLLLKRNPWLLLGMALVSMVIVILLKLIPFLGSLLVALLAPILMSSGLLAANDLSKQKMSLPASLRMAAFARSPLALLRPLRDEKYTVTMLILAIYAVTMALLINISLEVISDGAWARDLAVVQGSDFLTTLGGKSVACLLYLGLSMSLIYAVPLIVLRDESLVPALGRSLRTSARYIVSLAVILGVLVGPFFVGGLTSFIFAPSSYAVWLIGGVLALPLFATSCYCSYRTVFPAD